MKTFSLGLLALATALAISPVALAQATYNFTFSFTGVGFSGQGSLVGVLGSTPGTYYITGGTGTFTNSSGSDTYSLFANHNQPGTAYSPSGFFIYDDKVTPGTVGLILDVDGLLFIDSRGSELNLWGNGVKGNGTDTWYTWYLNSGYNGGGTFSITVPEYSGLSILLLSALTLVGGFIFQARKPGMFQIV